MATASEILELLKKAKYFKRCIEKAISKREVAKRKEERSGEEEQRHVSGRSHVSQAARGSCRGV